MIPSILPKNGRELKEHSSYTPSPPLKPVQSILKSRYVPSPPTVAKTSVIHMQQSVAPVENLHHLPCPPNSKPKANIQKAASSFIPLNAEKSQSLLKSQRKPSLISTLQRQSSEKYTVPLQRKASKIPVLQARSNTQVLPPIKATQSTINSGDRKVSFRLSLLDVKEFRSKYSSSNWENGGCLVLRISRCGWCLVINVISDMQKWSRIFEK